MREHDPLPQLPLALHPPHLIPPAPTPDHRALSFLPDFGGLPWVAYAAGSLLVVSHLPSPPRTSGSDTVEDESPFFCQVIDLHTPVSAVAWCGRGRGELAAASGNSVSVFQPAPSSGSFSWLLRWVITEMFTVTAIAWTGSGDGIVVVGGGVAMWARVQSSWQLAWRSTPQVPQSLVSATHFVHAPVVAASAAAPVEGNVPVLVFLNDAKLGLETAELLHPQPVSMIQWRPLTLSVGDPSEVRREILMTCCLDGTARLWTGAEVTRSKKQPTSRRSFSVIAVIELDNILNGVLGVDISVRWAVETGSVVSRDEEAKFKLFSGHSWQNKVGKCEWLVSVGPGRCTNFWAAHCLDDVSPPRYPRITLWKQSEPQAWEESAINPKSTVQPIFVETVISRSICSGPPTRCSLLHLLPDNSFIWSRLAFGLSSDSGSHVSSDSSKSISCCSTKTINQVGHKGSIIEVSVHPYSCEIELAVSMDSSRMLFVWSLSTLSTLISTLHAPTYPSWKLLCKFDLHDISSDAQYSCLCWAPSVFHDNRFLVLGGENGADLVVARIPNGGVVSCHKMFTVPFLGGSNAEEPPDSIHTIPLASNCNKSFLNNSFLIVCVWRKRFQVLSWKVVLHSKNHHEGRGCLCEFSANSLSTADQGRHVTYVHGEMFAAAIYEGSTVFPTVVDGEYPTCISVMSLDNTVLPLQQHVPFATSPGYHIATGYSDGTVKLWKMSGADNPLQTGRWSNSWELVGMFGAHPGPISAISLSRCGRVATVGRNVQKNNTSIHIWEAVKLMGDGCFLLEDALMIQSAVVGLDWLSLGNGRFLLAVCFRNKLHIYSHKHPSFQNVLHTANLEEKHLWSCIALAHSHHDVASFCWGPKASIALVHNNHLSLFSSWLVRGANERITQKGVCSATDVHDKLPCTVHVNETIFGKSGLSENYSNAEATENNSTLLPGQHNSHCSNGLWSLLDISSNLSGPLAPYHPRALIHHLYSGEWKRADGILQHLVESMKASTTLNTLLDCSSCSKSCHNIPELPLSRYFTHTPSSDISSKGLLWGENGSSTAFNLLSPSNSFSYMTSNLGINTTTSASERSEISQLLDKNFGMFAISDTEKIQIHTVSDLLGEITDQNRASPYKTLDEAGRRFWIAVQFQRLYVLRRSGDSSSAEGCHLDSASIAWAFQSDCQDDLLDYVLPAESTWLEMQNLGMGLWYTNVSQLRIRMEKLARLQYLKSKDPKDCALLYIALNRIKVLVGLFKVSRNEKDKRLYEFLCRNFQEEKNKAAALKNAYVLLGRHQWELAIAFFLLGGDTSSAINVCAKNLQDEQLAMVICRLVEGSGGPLERNLISNVLLPDAVEKGDHWLSSLLEWMLGNYSQSVSKLFGCHPKLLFDESDTHGGQNVFADPELGQYCAILSTKNSFRNCAGEALSAKLSKLSFALAACALNRCGLPLEALECLSSKSSIVEKDGTSSQHGADDKILDGILNPFNASSNWLSSSVVNDVESELKVTMASNYLSRMLRNHFLCAHCGLPLAKDKVLKEHNSHGIEELAHDVSAAISIFHKRFSLQFYDVAEKILTSCSHDGLLFLAHVLLSVCRSPDGGTNSHCLEGCASCSIDYLLLVSCKESFKFLTRYVVSCCFICSVLNTDLTNITACTPLENMKYIIATLSHYQSTSRLLLKHDLSRTSALDKTSAISTVIDLLDYNIGFSVSWLCHDIKALLIMSNPVLGASANDESCQVLLGRLMQAAHHKSHGISINTEAVMPNGSLDKRQPGGSEDSSLSIDEKWHLIGASLWIGLSSFMKHHLKEFIGNEKLECEACTSDVKEFKGLASSVAAKFVIDSLQFVSSSLVRLHASFFREKLSNNLHPSVLFWLEYMSSQPRSNKTSRDQLAYIAQGTNTENMEVLFHVLWEISANSLDICAAFVNEDVNCFPLNNTKLSRSWKNMVESTKIECENDSTQSNGGENKCNVSSKDNEKGRGFVGKASSDVETSLEPKRKCLIEEKGFQSPKELLRRNGELLEAICLNSTNEQHAAIATNRKGLVFFNWYGNQQDKKSAEYILSGSEWPSDGWACPETTPAATLISPSVGPGRRRGSHLGSDGANIGVGSLVKPGRDLTGGGAFGIPGYAGIGASGFGWGEPDEFEDFVDPPATLENIHSRALSRHPSLPLLLVGSSNTHVYLWEFGKDSARATYGVLPAANIPPPYALASISAVQFDYYGQRFATAALDGTICTWQVEVGGRSNVHPTESSLCFDSHASGSVLTAAGCNSNGANVVILDMLAPPATCQTSIVCHEGGARSLTVFDNNIGCGSISPLIVTGGKSGDVALHDFRFVSTGKSKHHKTSAGGSSRGMIWHIPKAHLGSVTSLSTIPDTTLFLTGSKDGDVKLWDAKNSQLVFHWPKLHERHTFFQPTSRGFGGVVRAAVTDIHVLTNGFVSCGGDGSVKLVQIKNEFATVHQD
ncbi:uncharacterized protein LOC125543966 isoform X2 [Triticum urartu]|uniref:uncharacterized protein LOC125543966 isoform X2 n=1 Tax=Triticum urartu TaxID=4572 RepID=UPI0020443FCA|nr:uncharacterized protein LOC125543966 isoform X2 [Triticum urartu]